MATASVPGDDERDLECPVCHEPFRTPKMLPCGHTICLAPCLQQLAKDRDSLKCPECRADHQLPGGRVDGFPTNIFIVRLLKTDVVPKKLLESFCPLCNSEEPLVKCFHCSSFVCESCRMMHTKELQAEVLKFLEECAENEDRVAEKEATMKQASSKLQSQVKSYIDTIETVVAALIENVQLRGENLVKHVREYKQEEEVAISDRVTDVAKKIDQLHEFCSKAISDLKGQKIVTQNQLLKTKENATKQLSHLEESTSSIPSIKERKLDIDTGNLLSTIRKLGDFAEVKKVDDKCADDVSPTNESQSQSAGAKDGTSPTQAAICNVSGTCKDEKPNTSAISGPSAASPPAPISVCQRDYKTVNKCIGRKGTADGQFNRPICLAVCPRSGNIVVGEYVRCQIFNAKGEHVKSLAKCIDNLCNIREIQMSNNGNIYVLDNNMHNTLHIFNYPGVPHKSVGFSHVNVHSICMDPNEYVHVCCGTDGVRVFDTDGKMCSQYCPDADGKFDARQIAISSDKTIYVTNVDVAVRQHYFFVLNDSYQPIRWGPYTHIGKVLDGQIVGCFYPGKMRIIEDKYFLIAHRESHRVYLFDFNWKKVKCFGVQGHCRGQIHHPTGSDVTKDGELVVISENCMLQFFQ